jgi:hypothetical protein
MERTKLAQSRKADAARRQLGTALRLWLDDLDPVSVHVLASGGCEVAEALAKKVGKPFSVFSLEVHTELTEPDLWKARNTFWNAMKHVIGKDGVERDDEEILATPLESENEARLSAGWYDLIQIMPVPIEAHTLIMWFLAKYGNRTELDDWPEELFPGLLSSDVAGQKALLRRQIEIARNHPEVMADPRIDKRPLIIPG